MAIDLDVHGNTKPLEAAVQAAINRIRRQPIKITVDDKGATQPLGNMKRAADEFSKSMEAANARILAFGASMAIINGVADAFKGMVRNMVEVEKSMADINVVMGLSAQNLDKFGDGLFKVAKETGAAFRVAADAATEYARQGLSMEESLKRTRDALILTRLTGMDSAEAVKSLTAAMNTYGNQIKDTTQLVSKFAAVDVQFAVSAEDFAAAISRTGQAAKSAGVDIDELIGIVTSAQQQTARGGAVIGNALKTIFTKTGRTDTLNQLEDLGIAVRDLEGNTIGAKRILTELANTFDHLSEAQKAQITQTMGGLFHINILKAVLSDAAKQNGILARATEISSSATDEAIQKNQQLRETMSAMATETGLAIKQVSTQIGEIALAPGMEKILNTVKSLAEGLSGVLGDGEGVGNKFATGFLKGIGNIITGPGLVILTTVFVKLFMTAAKFTKESLSSLIGVTTEAQKQKAIQTSLVALIGQNAALGKEMLRTDITRTEKEKILLGLLQAQTAEASKLNAISKQLASTLYTRGYGPGLTQGKRRAYGHIPNFADAERSQAARGGYAAGSIRSMNMPGEGSVIYNSAETVKNFAGFKQPAIMPPQSSKAGKNYQQAFGGIHGFDPYAAGGYIPNFARGGKGVGAKPRIDLSNPAIMAEIDKKTRYLNAGSSKYIGLSASLGPDKPKQTFYVAGGSGTDSGIYNQKGRSFYKKAAMQRVQPRKIDVEFKSLDEKDERRGFERYDDEINSKLQKRSAMIASGMLKTFGYGSMNSAAIEKDLPKSKMATVAGHIFEAVTKSVLRAVGAEAAIPDGPTELIDLKYNKELYELFGVPTGKGSSGAEAKINTNLKNVMSFARKIYSSDPTTKTPLNLSSLPRKTKAYGHIPNFADPLSDAIGREKAAGVPVSQIRVGSHSALMNKGNPLGLGVTNTHDEPNGLRDVFGAGGFVPNYALNPYGLYETLSSRAFGVFGPDKQSQDLMKKLAQKMKQQEKAVSDHTRSLQNLKAGTDKHARAQALLTQTSTNLQQTRSRMDALEKRGIMNSMRRAGGAMSSGMGMATLGMASGFVQNETLSSTMAYASTGGYMGHMLSPILGPLAPFGTLIGTAAGALYGFNEALDSSKRAVKENQAAFELSRREALGRGLASSLSKKIFTNQDQQISLSGEMISMQEYYLKKAAGVEAIPPDVETFLGSRALATKEQAAEIRKRDAIISDRKDFAKHGGGGPEARNIIIKGLQAYGQEILRLPKIERTKDPEGNIAEVLSDKTERQAVDVFLRQLMETGILNDIDNLSTLSAAILQIRKDEKDASEELSEAIIDRTNKEKILLSSQDEFNKAMHSSSYFSQMMANEYKLRMATMSDYMTEEEIASAKLAEAKRVAADTYSQSVRQAEQTAKEALINLLKDDKYEQGLTDYLKTAKDGKKMTEKEFGEKGLSQLQDASREIFKSVAGGEKAIEEIIGNQNYQLDIQKGKYEGIQRLSELRAENEAETTRQLIAQQTGPGSFDRGMRKGFVDMRQQVDRMDYQLGKRIPTAFADGLAGAMTEAINGTKSIKEGLMDAAVGFLGMIQQAMMQKMAYQMVGAMGFSKGGNVRKYSKGGGVPAMVSNGEYVMSRDAVNKYGGSFMHGMNAGGRIPGFAGGGEIQKQKNPIVGKIASAIVSKSVEAKAKQEAALANAVENHLLSKGKIRREGAPGGPAAQGSALASNFGGGRGFDSGRLYQRKAMSSSFYAQSGNVGLGEDTSAIQSILSEEERIRQEAEAKRQAKKAKRRQLLGMVASIGLMYGLGKMNLFGSKTPAPGSGGIIPGTQHTLPIGKYLGGPIRKYASGGYISGKSGIDQIPAMLSEGEYVIRASSARQIGKPMLDQINAGKFYDGGAVSEIGGSSETGSTGGNTNNISISINMERGSSNQKQQKENDSSGANPADTSNDEKSNSELAERIKQQVVSVIVEEQRPGGLLSD